MNSPSVVSISVMPAVNRTGRRRSRTRGCAGGQQRGRGQQGDLGGGVEAQPEQHPDRVQLPLLGDRLHPAAEEPVEEPAGFQLALELGLVVLAAAHRSEDPTIPARITRFSSPIKNRNDADTIVPNNPPNRSRLDPLSDTAENTVFSATTFPVPIATTTVEWPREKKNPNPNGRGCPVPCRSPSTLRVVLSIAEIWSASNACRSPSV